ncbi:MAG TPA: carboxypeptidase regulatory-like domain-containing protein [Flavipsychrobacter sp.]|nr:carboxypeptidase regulatory-like domain-containing protein [Flavipsychrobacter sp.]
MKRPTSIQLNIDRPCHEDWDKMNPQEQGRFCDSCQKTVIDFTTWSDKDLYNFFVNYQNGVCGRFFGSQLKKELHIPPQPTSRLYRLAIACGLTLMFAQIPQAHSRVRQPIELLAYEEDGGDDKNTNAKERGSLKGQVMDENGLPVAYAIVEVTMKGIKKTQTVADMNGSYNIESLPVGRYELSAKVGKKKATLINIRIAANTETNKNISITTGLGIQAPEPIMMGGAVPEPIMKGDVAPEPILMGEPAMPEPPPKIGKPSIKKGKVKAR